MPGWITLSSLCMVGAGALALSMENLSGPVRRPVVGSKYSMTWKSLTWMWMGCSSLLWLTNLHSSTELSCGWISGTLGNAPPSNAYTNAFGSSVLAKLLRNPPDIRICRLTSRGVSEVDKGRVATERLTFDEGGRYATPFRGCGS